MLKPFLTHRTPQEPLHPSTLSMVLKKIKHDVVLLPCACGRFILYSHPFRYISLHSISATLLRFVHFTHLSTAQQKWLILSLLQSPARWLSLSWHLQNPTHLCFLPTHFNFGMLYFFLRLINPQSIALNTS